MPELPEVETVCRGLQGLIGQRIEQVVVRRGDLRWPIEPNLGHYLEQQTLGLLWRRSKYLIWSIGNGHVLIHLGMSGSLRIGNNTQSWLTHDHWIWHLSNGQQLIYHDPRRFGALLWTQQALENHPRLHALGPEPLSTDFNGDYLQTRLTNRKTAIKTAIMDSKVVVGVGNIYACEALFGAKIHPFFRASQLSLEQYHELVQAIKQTLQWAISEGGTTLRDFRNAQSGIGYFQQKLAVYGRGQQPCTVCQQPIQRIVQQQRSSFFCHCCQPLPQ